MESRPYRTYLRVARPEQLAAATEADNRHDDPYQPYELERALITEWATKIEQIPDQLASRWLLHPDERVQVEFIRLLRQQKWNVRVEDWNQLRDVFAYRLIRGADTEQVGWTPLFEEIFTKPHWDDLEYLLSRPIFYLAPWLRTFATRDDVRELLHAFPYLRSSVLEHAGCIDLDFTGEIYATYNEPEVLSGLARNHFLSSDVVAYFATRLVDDWIEVLHNREPHVFEPWGPLTTLIRAHSSIVPIDVIRKVYSCADEFARINRSLPPGIFHPDYFAQTKSQTAYRSFVLLSEEIAQNPIPLSKDDLHTVMPFLQNSPYSLLTLLTRSNADASTWRVALKLCTSSDLQVHAASDPNLRWDSEIRAKLLVSKNPRVLRYLIEDADPQTAAKLVRRLIRLGLFHAVVEALNSRPPEATIALRPEDLTPLLQSKSQEIRTATIAILGRLKSQPNAQSLRGRISTARKNVRIQDA